MNKNDKLAKHLTREREAIRQRLQMVSHPRISMNDISNGRESAAGDPDAALELAQQDVLREQEVRAYERLALQAKILNKAWESLERGTYGTCQECGQAIPRRRLEAVPGTTFCVRCQEKREQTAVGVHG